MIKYIALLALAISCILAPSLAEDSNPASTEGSASEGLETAQNHTLLNLTEFAQKNVVEPGKEYLISEVARGENASVNLAQVPAGSTMPLHYHEARDEVDYVMAGRANMTISEEVVEVKAGDMIYIPANTLHGWVNFGNETLKLMTVFAPPFDGEDRIFA